MRIQAHCTAMDIKLVDIVVDAGESAKSLDRPGIQAALKMLKQGKADALIVMKLELILNVLTESCRCGSASTAASHQDAMVLVWKLATSAASLEAGSAGGTPQIIRNPDA